MVPKKKKNLAGWEKLVINYVSNSGQWWNMPRHFSSIITNYINSSACRAAQLAQKFTLGSCIIYTQKNIDCYGYQIVDVGDLIRNYCMAFYGCHVSKCTEYKDATQKYLSTDRKWEINLQGQSLLMHNRPKCKRLKRIRYN